MTRAVDPADREVPDEAPIEFGRSNTDVLQLRLQAPKSSGFYARLLDEVQRNPAAYRHAPVIIDLADLVEAPPFNLAEVVRRLRQIQLVPIAAVGGTAEQQAAALNAGLAQIVRPEAVAPVAAPEGAAPPSGTSKLVTTPLRSGRQVYARGGDLIVCSQVGAGSELLADGHIHIYGTLRGRALAGVQGDTSARIFCRSLDAELISIAGYWMVRDQIDEDLIGQAVQILLQDETLLIERLA